ncbi:MAG TPA: YdeI/OmpD-associated family protein [Actinocrinis sp.]
MTQAEGPADGPDGSTESAESYQGEPMLAFASVPEWEAWLAAQHGSAAGLWLKLGKKGCAQPSVSYSEALDVALCFGWIDAQKRPLDEEYWLQRFTARKPRSKWSKINRGRAEALIAAGRMRPAGLGEVERARQDGRWEAAYAGQATAEVPEDLQRALDAEPQAAAFFAALDRGNRYAVIYRVQEAKREATRAARIEKFVEMLRRHETIHPVPAGRNKAAGKAEQE